jgi:uroporphyrinogen-III decarboxylase
MIPRERVVKAMSLEHPDRVPSMSQFSIGFMNQQLKGTGITPMELWLDAEKYAEALLYLREKFGFDGILVSLHGHDPHWREKIKKVEIVDGIEVAHFDDRIETYVDDDLPVGKFFETRIRDIEDPDLLSSIPDTLDYISESRDCYSFLYLDDPYRIFKILDKKVQGRYSIHAEVTSALDYLLDLLGYENALMAMILQPDTCKALLQKFTDGIVKMAKGLCTQNIDAVKISSPFAGMDFISPDFYREFELPYVTQIVKAIHESGKFSYIHTCGSINDRLEMMQASGASGLECLDPPPIGNVELEDAFDRIGDTMFIKGNVDSVNTLLFGDDEKVHEDILSRIRTGMRNKGFILSTACSIAPKVPAERIRKLTDMAETYGVYPSP